jgi:hypothetical protein
MDGNGWAGDPDGGLRLICAADLDASRMLEDGRDESPTVMTRW